MTRRDAIMALGASIVMGITECYHANFPKLMRGDNGVQGMLCYKITNSMTGKIYETGMSSDTTRGVVSLVLMRKSYYEGRGVDATYDIYRVKQQGLIS